MSSSVTRIISHQMRMTRKLSAPMLHKKYDDPSPLLSGEDDKIVYKASPPCNYFRLQWRVVFYLLLGLIILLLLYAAMKRDASSSSRMEDIRQPAYSINAIIEEINEQASVRLKIEVYMESECPDTADFLDNQLMPTWNQLKEYMDLKIVPYGKASWTKIKDDYQFECQHGENECLVNQLMCCGIENLKSPILYLPYVVCLQLSEFGDKDEMKCAKRAGLNWPEMKDCANSTRGRALHYRMGNLTESLSPPLDFVPWIVIDGKDDSAAFTDLKQSICRRLARLGVQPKPCEKSTSSTQ